MGLFDFLFKKKVDGTYPPKNPGKTKRENESGDDRDCNGKESVIRSRIEMIASEGWPSYELRRTIPATDLGGTSEDHDFDYGFYLNGEPKLMIMILEEGQYRNQNVVRAHAACKARGIASFHLMKHLPNRKTYIADRIRALMP